MAHRLSRTLLACAAIVLPAAASAAERHFTYTYESSVLAPGEREVEIWTTYRRGRAGGLYSALDNRLEYEVGLTERLQTAFYINTSSETVQVSATETETEAEFKGVSSEWKYKVSDPVADAVGFAAYGEIGLGSEEAEIELKAIFDKRIGNTLLAANLVYEAEFEFEAQETEVEHVGEIDLAAARFLAPNFAVGIEARNHNEYYEGELEHSAVFVGPAAFLSGQAMWATLTVQPQVAALKGETDDKGLVLDEHERFEARLLVGIHF